MKNAFTGLIVILSIGFLAFEIKPMTKEKTVQHPMVEGINHTIQYVTWNGEKWSAEAQGVNCTWLNGILLNASDPGWEHHGKDNHSDGYIAYKSDVGQNWAAVIHTHSSLDGSIEADFEHSPGQGTTGKAHGESYMLIQDWDGVKWKVNIPKMYPKKGSGSRLDFECHKVVK
jgi:hypothetical protein